MWCKAHVLEDEDVRRAFEQREETEERLDETGFREFIMGDSRTTLTSNGPSFCRPCGKRSRSTAARNMREMLSVLWRYHQAVMARSSPVFAAPSSNGGGLGLFVRKKTQMSAGKPILPRHVWGALQGIDDPETYAKLQAVGYPSLYSQGNAILIGPLSLANHACTAPAVFSHPQRFSDDLPEFENLQAVRARASSDGRLSAGQELLINYFPDDAERRAHSLSSTVMIAGQPCRCRSCLDAL